MKPVQWVGAVLILAAMVFAITFAMNYLGGSGGKQVAVEAKTVRQLRFHVPFAPAEGGLLECETRNKRTYHQDFWFKNENAEDVKLGLDGTSCQCSSVRLYTLPDEALARLGPFYAGMAGRIFPAAAFPLSCIISGSMAR